MIGDHYQTIILNHDIGRKKTALWGFSVSAVLVLIFFHIYFIYAALGLAHAVESLKKEMAAAEYSYLEASGGYQELMRDTEEQNIAGENFTRIADVEFVSRAATLVLR